MTSPPTALQAPAESRRPSAPALDRWLGRAFVHRYRLCAAAVLVLITCNVFAGLGEARVDNSDEARYGVAAYEMLRDGNWLVATYAGATEYWNLKPPLGYWLMKLSFATLGVTPFALRLPSALAAIATVALTMALARRWLGRREAVVSGLILATTFGYLSHHGARSGDLDSVLTLLVVAVMAQLPRLATAAWRWPFLGATFGAIFLLKSFAVLPALAVAASFLLLKGGLRRLAPLLGAVALMGLLALGWAAARTQADGSVTFVRRMVSEDLVQRSCREIDRGSQSPFGYLDQLPDRYAPWPVFGVVAGALAWRERSRLRARWQALDLPLLWFGIPFVLFSLAQTRHHWYLDPIYPAAAMITAAAVLFLARRIQSGGWAICYSGLVLLAFVGCEARVLQRTLVSDRMPEEQRFLLSLARLPAGSIGELYAGFPLQHSERFLLEAVDGFRVVEPPARATEPATAQTGDRVLLLSVPPRDGARVETPPAGARLLAAGAGYRVFSLSAAALAAAEGPATSAAPAAGDRR